MSLNVNLEVMGLVLGQSLLVVLIIYRRYPVLYSHYNVNTVKLWMGGVVYKYVT